MSLFDELYEALKNTVAFNTPEGLERLKGIYGLLSFNDHQQFDKARQGVEKMWRGHALAWKQGIECNVRTSVNFLTHYPTEEDFQRALNVAHDDYWQTKCLPELEKGIGSVSGEPYRKAAASLERELVNNQSFWNALVPHLFQNGKLNPHFETSFDDLLLLKEQAGLLLFQKELPAIEEWLQGIDSYLPEDRERLYTQIGNILAATDLSTVPVGPESQTQRLLQWFADQEVLSVQEFKPHFQKLYNRLQQQCFSYWINRGSYDNILQRLASASTVEAMQKLLADPSFSTSLKSHIDKLSQNVPERIVTPETCAKLAEVAAIRMTKQALKQTEDKEVLSKLAAVKSVDELKRLIAKSASLGFNRDEHSEFRKSLNEAALKELKAAARVRLTLLTASDAQLRQMVKAGGPRELRRFFQPDHASKKQKEAFESYFTVNQNLLDTQNEALIQLVKPQFKNLSNEDIIALFTQNVDSQRWEMLVDDRWVNTVTNLAGVDVFDVNLSDYQPALWALAYEAIAENYVRTNGLTILTMNGLDANPDAQRLTATQKDAIRLRSVQALIAKNPAFIKALLAANNKDLCKKCLKDKGILNVEWVTDDVVETLQKLAVLQSIQEHLGRLRPELLPQGHSSLMKLVEQLPLAQQRRLLKKPDVYLPFLMTETDEKRLREALELTNKEIDLKELLKDNEWLGLVDQIENAALASLFYKYYRVISKEQLDEINAKLENLSEDKIKKYLNENWELEEEVKDGIIQNILAEHQENQYLYSQLGNTHLKTGLHFLLTVAGPCRSAEHTAFNDGISAANSIGEFKKNPGVPQAFRNKMTPAIFKECKKESLKMHFETYPAEGFEKDKAFLESMKKSFKDLQALEGKNSVRKELEKIRGPEMLTSVKVAFANGTTTETAAYLAYLKKLDKICTTVFSQLKEQKALLELHLNALVEAADDLIKEMPLSTVEQREKRAKLREQKTQQIEALRSQIEKVNAELLLHEEAQKNIKEALVLLDVASMARPVLQEKTFSGYTIAYGEYRDEEKADHLTSAAPARLAARPSRELSIFSELDEPKPEDLPTKTRTAGHSNIVTVARDDGTMVARFVEEPEKGGVKVTASKFPTPASNPDPDCLVAGFAMAMEYLQLREAGVPTSQSRLIIDGSSPHELSYLWTALMILGKNTPGWSFNEKSIGLTLPARGKFRPEDQLGFDITSFSGFSSESLHAKIQADPTTKAVCVETLKVWQVHAKRMSKGKTLRVDGAKRVDGFVENYKEKMKSIFKPIQEKTEESEGLVTTPRLRGQK